MPVLAFALFSIQPVLAHGEEPRIEISVERISPGGVLEVRGVDFEYDETVTLALVGEGYEYPLGEITVDPDGIFLKIVTLPVDLMAGIYHFSAVTDDHVILSPALAVQGTARIDEGGSDQEQREYEDGFSAPIPTYPPGVIPGAPPAPTQTIPETLESPGANAPLVAIGAVVFVFGMILIVKQRRKSR